MAKRVSFAQDTLRLHNTDDGSILHSSHAPTEIFSISGSELDGSIGIRRYYPKDETDAGLHNFICNQVLHNVEASVINIRVDNRLGISDPSDASDHRSEVLAMSTKPLPQMQKKCSLGFTTDY